MVNELLSKTLELLKKKALLIAFLFLCVLVFMLSSTLLFSGSCTDIVLILLLWSLPLFIH